MISPSKFAWLLLILVAPCLYAQSTERPKSGLLEFRGAITSFGAGVSSPDNPDINNLSERDLGIKKAFAPEFRFIFTPGGGGNKIRFDYLHQGFDSDQTLTRRVEFDGRIFNVNARVNGELSLRQLRFAYAYRFGNDKFRIGPMVDVRVVRAKARLATVATGGGSSATVSEQVEGTLPGISIGGDFDAHPTDKLHLYGFVSGLKASKENASGSFFDSEFGLRYYPSRHFGLTGGFKYLRISGSEDKDRVVVRTIGPFFGVALRF